MRGKKKHLLGMWYVIEFNTRHYKKVVIVFNKADI